VRRGLYLLGDTAFPEPYTGVIPAIGRSRMEELKDRIYRSLEELEKNDDLKEVLKITKGVAVSVLVQKTGNPPLKDVREAIYGLWEDGRITVWESPSKVWQKNILCDLLDSDEWLLSTPVASSSKGKRWIVCRSFI